MAEEPGDVAVAADAWPHAPAGLRHTDQLRAILAGMPRPAGREIDWAERIDFVRAQQPVRVLEHPALPDAERHEPHEPHEAAAHEPHGPQVNLTHEAAAHETAAHEPVTVAPYDTMVRPVAPVPMAPQPILWVPTSAFDGPPPAAVSAAAAVPVAVASPGPHPAVTAIRDPRFVPIAAAFSLPDSGIPTTGWTMRLGFGDPQPVPNPMSAAESMTFSSRRRRWRRALAVLVVVVVLAAAAAAGWMVWRHRQAAHHPLQAATVNVLAPPTASGG